MKKLDPQTISPQLRFYWKALWIGFPWQDDPPRTLRSFIRSFESFSSSFRYSIHDSFILNLKYTVRSTEEALAEMEADLAWLLSLSNDIFEECKHSYLLSRRQRRTLERMNRKNEDIWIRFDKKLATIVTANEDLLWELPDMLPEGEFELIENNFFLTKNYRYRFLLN